MKRLLNLYILAIVFLFAACGTEPVDSTDSTAQAVYVPADFVGTWHVSEGYDLYYNAAYQYTALGGGTVYITTSDYNVFSVERRYAGQMSNTAGAVFTMALTYQRGGEPVLRAIAQPQSFQIEANYYNTHLRYVGGGYYDYVLRPYAFRPVEPLDPPSTWVSEAGSGTVSGLTFELAGTMSR